MNVTGWPFRVNIDSDLGADGETELHVGLADADEAFPMVNGVVQAFIALAQKGGLAGRMLDATASGLTLVCEAPAAPAAVLRWHFGNVWIDACAWNVLFNMLEATEEVIASVHLRTGTSNAIAQLVPDTYPGLASATPFQLEMGATGSHVTVEIEFADAPGAAGMAAVLAAIDSWALVGASGGYRRKGVSATQSFIPFVEDPRVYADGLVFDLESITADEHCLNGLVNLLARASREVARIESVSLY
jgi:hypothetical protein